MNNNQNNVRSTTDEESYTIEEVAEVIGTGWSRAHELIVKQGRMKAIQVGNGGRNSPKWKVPKSEVVKFLEQPRTIGRPRISDKRA